MRTLFWCGCAMAVTAASLVYLAADYASEYPDSPVGRGVLTAYRVGTQYNPIFMLTQVMTQHCCRSTVQSEPCAAATQTDPGSKNAGSDSPANTDAPSIEVIDLSKLQDTNPPADESGSSETQEATGTPPPACYPHCAGGIDPVSVPPTDIQENEDELKTMPRCVDEESEPPVSMPSIVGEEPQAESADESAAEEIAAPQVEGDDEPKTEDAEQPKSETGGNEESEATSPGEPPNCREDAHYHQQYPSCPYMGGCPSSDHCPTAAPTEPQATHKKKHKKKSSATVQPLSGAPKSAPPTQCGSDEGCVKHSEIDTMEYRKSDAKEGEFKRQPF